MVASRRRELVGDLRPPTPSSYGANWTGSCSRAPLICDLEGGCALLELYNKNVADSCSEERRNGVLFTGPILLHSRASNVTVSTENASLVVSLALR